MYELAYIAYLNIAVNYVSVWLEDQSSAVVHLLSVDV